MARDAWGIGIIGLGGIAAHHLEGYRRQGLKVVAGYDLDAERSRKLAEQFKIPAVESSPEALLARADVKIADITVPHDVTIRRPLVKAAARNGKAIFIQKPLANRLEDALSMVEIAETAGVPMMVNQNSLFAPQALALEPFLRKSDPPRAGWIGEPYYFQIENRAWFNTHPEHWFGKNERWVNSDMAIHHYALIHHWFGKAESISAVLRHDRSQTATVGETVATVLIRFKSGVQGLTITNWSYRGPRHRSHPNEEIVIQGDRGSITADAGEVVVVGDDGEHRVAVEGTWFPDAFGRSMAHFVDALDSGRPYLCSGRDNLQPLAIMEAAYRSAAERREVKVAELL